MIDRRWVIFVLGLLAGVGAMYLAPTVSSRRAQAPAEAPKARANKPLYYCPMHPSVVSTKPGDCPVCGMRLQRMDDHDHAADGAQEKPKGRGKILFYRHPMRPDVTSPSPAKDEMGMDYIPVYEGEQAEEGPVSGHAVVKLPKWRQQLIGVSTTEASRRPLSASIRTVGKIAYDPELYTALTEYREALASRQKVKDSPWPDVHERAEALVNASKLRLRLMGISEQQLAALGDEKESSNLLMGKAGGTLWVYADVYEYDVGLVAVGQPIEVTVTALPGRTFRGTIKAIDPVLNPNTRTIRVRAEIPNERGVLKPEMFVNVLIKVPLGRELSVPAEAVFDTGKRQLVFVEVAEGEFEPREVKVGRQADGYYEIVSGVKEGERVVSQANFLMDSESKLRATGAKAGQGPPK